MKKNRMRRASVKIIAAILSCVTWVSYAQNTSKKPCERLDKTAEIWKDSLQLTSEQYSKILALNSMACNKIQTLKKDSTKSKEVKKTEAREIHKNLKQEYKTILTVEQKKKLAQMKQGRKPEKKSKHTLEEKAKKITDKQKDSLFLTPEQESKMYAENISFLRNIELISDMKKSGATEAAVKAKRKEFASLHKSNVEKILSADQLAKLKELKSKNKSKVKK